MPRYTQFNDEEERNRGEQAAVSAAGCTVPVPARVLQQVCWGVSASPWKALLGQRPMEGAVLGVGSSLPR